MDIDSFSGPIVTFRIFIQEQNPEVFDFQQEWIETDTCPTFDEAKACVEHFIKQGLTKVRIQVEVG